MRPHFHFSDPADQKTNISIIMLHKMVIQAGSFNKAATIIIKPNTVASIFLNN